MVLAILDKTAPSVFAALDVTLRRLGGAPTYVLPEMFRGTFSGFCARPRYVAAASRSWLDRWLMAVCR